MQRVSIILDSTKRKGKLQFNQHLLQKMTISSKLKTFKYTKVNFETKILVDAFDYKIFRYLRIQDGSNCIVTRTMLSINRFINN